MLYSGCGLFHFYLRRVQAEIESQQLTEDERADAERTEATDIRTLAKG